MIFVVALLLIAFPSAGQKLPEFEKLLVDASNLLRQGEYRKSQTEFARLLRSSQQMQNDYYAARSRIGLSASQLGIHDYKEAVQNGEAALRYGLATKDANIAVRAALNLSSVYRRMRDFPAAVQTLRDLNPILPLVTDIQAKTQVYLHAAMNFGRSGDRDRSEPLFYASIDSALSQGDVQTAAFGWNQLGVMRLQQNDLAKADAALTEAFRLRRLAGNRNLGASYMYLAMLRLTQGDAVSALNLLESAIRIASGADVSVPAYALYYWRAKAKTASGATASALADFERAVSMATRWRQEVLPADSFRITAEVGLNYIYEDYVQTGMRAWEATKDVNLARRMFEVSEQHRSASFRELQSSSKVLPAEYWEALTNYRSALASSLTAPQSPAIERARVTLTQVESSLGLATTAEGSAKVSEIQSRLSDTEALISFHTGLDRSYAWAITRGGFESQILPGRREIAAVAAQFRQAIEKNGELAGANTKLYGMLFEGFSSRIQSRRDWLLSLDQGLYDVPFAALGPPKAPLVLLHSLRTIPGAALLSQVGFVSQNTGFVGFGDAIYNSADPRWKGPRTAQIHQYARLVNTRREVTSASQAWTADTTPTLLFGDSFNRAALERAVEASPAIVHIAAHVVQGQSDASNVMIGIGLTNDGKLDFLTPADVAARRAKLGLVSINGCASGSGAALPGAGLIGLTRSWLLAGATAVAATYWPVEDDRGELFAGMYRELTLSGATITPSKAARALQKAQVAAFQSGGARSAPNIWSAVFLAAKR